jgi:hypothetical protein
MRHQNVGREAAIGRNTEMVMRGTHILFAGPASRASAAADPRINGNLSADDCSLGAFARRFDDTGDLVAKRKWQGAILGDIEPPVAAQREIAILHMKIRMTDAAACHTHQHFAAARRRTIGRCFGQGLSIRDKGLSAKLAHGVLSPAWLCFSIGLERDKISSIVIPL